MTMNRLITTLIQLAFGIPTLWYLTQAIKDIKDDEKEVLRNSGHSFLKKYKARISTHNKTDSKKE